MADELSPDFLKQKYRSETSASGKKPRRIALKVVVLLFSVLALSSLVLSYKVTARVTNETPSTDSSFSLFGTFKRLVTSGDKELVGEVDDRINILLLGVGGPGHDGPELSDTIMFASFKPSTNEVGLLSIPRDLTVDLPGYGYRKINHANAYGELQEKGNGPRFASEVIGGMLDQQIHYSVKVNFASFEKLIDAIGGVDVYVDKSFTDSQYPAPNDLYQTISFKEGWQTMNGEKALQYARSRHGNNGEGSDFARATRQQKVILAAKEKLISPSVLLNPSKLNKMIEIFQENVETNMTFWEMLKFAKFAPDVNTEGLVHHVLVPGNDGLLYETRLNNAYTLLPKNDDFSDIRALAKTIFAKSESTTDAVADAPAVKRLVKVEIQNGTKIAGLAFQTSQLLSSSGFTVSEVGNADEQSYSATVLYDLTEGQKKEEFELLKSFLATNSATSGSKWTYSSSLTPSELQATIPGADLVNAKEPVDFLIILGSDAKDLVLR